MTRKISQPSIKVIVENGQITLGKVEEREQGHTATVIPDHESGLQQPAATDLQQALAWAAAHPASDANIDAVMEKLHEGE